MGPQYDWLISEDTFREMIENMFTKYLFKNYLGVCVEDGVIWFDDNKITALSFIVLLVYKENLSSLDRVKEIKNESNKKAKISVA